MSFRLCAKILFNAWKSAGSACLLIPFNYVRVLLLIFVGEHFTMVQKQDIKSVMLIFAAGILWSFNGALCKLTSWGVLTLVSARGLIAILIIGKARGSYRIKSGKGEWMGALGVTGTSVLFILACKLTTAANAIVLQYAAPAFVILFSTIRMKQRPSREELCAALFVMLGVLLCFANGLGGGTLLGDSLALFSAATYSLVFLSAKYTSCSPVDYMYLGSLLSSLFVIFIPFDNGFSLTPQHISVWIALGCCLGFGDLMFSIGLRGNVSPVSASIITNVEAVLNPIWAFIAAGEAPGTLSVIGAISCSHRLQYIV
jgi:drug/metabolite transporter (DMT)-like permease